LVRKKLAVRLVPDTTALAVTVYVPELPLAVNVDAVARPMASLVWISTLAPVLANVPVAPVPGTANVTGTPTAGLPALLVNSTDIAGNAVPAAVANRVVAVVNGLGDMVATPVGVFVKANAPDVMALGVVAMTVKLPVAPLAVNVGAVATPRVFVTAVAVLVLVVANVPLAPLAGAVNVTVAPLTRLPSIATVAVRAAKAVPVLTDCGVPEATTVKPLLVRKKLAVRLVPDTTALAVSVKAPELPLAVNVDAVARPMASLVWVSTLVPVLANVPVAPVAGTLKMTFTPTAGAPALLVSRTDIVENAVPAAVTDRVVAVVKGFADIVGTPVAVFVSANEADVIAPVAVAITV